MTILTILRIMDAVPVFMSVFMSTIKSMTKEG